MVLLCNILEKTKIIRLENRPVVNWLKGGVGLGVLELFGIFGYGSDYTLDNFIKMSKLHTKKGVFYNMEIIPQ